ncbi:MAG: hypothetical protein ACTSQJ_18370, partial [Promethearchaeota archaeon]
MVKLKIHCPSCNKKGIIEVSEDLVKNIERGLIAVNVAENIVCEHSFIAYVDKNLVVRDYFIADFQIELPEVTTSPKNDIKKVPTAEIINIELIRIVLPASLIANIIASIFLKKKIVLISYQTSLYNHYLNFFKYLNEGAFDVDFTIISEDEYKRNKKKFNEYKNLIIFKGNNIIKNVGIPLDSKKLKVEKRIVKKFFDESVLPSSLIILKNEIQKAYLLSQSIVDFLEKIKDKKMQFTT